MIDFNPYGTELLGVALLQGADSACTSTKKHCKKQKKRFSKSL